MGQKKIIKHGEEARMVLTKGALELESAVKSTLGPMGRNVVIARLHSGPQVTKDGVSVANEIDLVDEFENCGAQMIKETSQLTGKDAGDGTTTSTVFACGIVVRGMDAISKGYNPIELARGIDVGCKLAVNALTGYVTQIEPDHKLLEDVATVSSNNEKDLGAIVAKAIRQATRYGVVMVEENTGYDTYVESVEGFRFDNGFESPLLITDIINQSIDFGEAFILFIDGKVDNGRDLVTPLEIALDKNVPLLIIAKEFGPEAMHFIVGNKAHGNAIACVKAPGFASTRRDMLDDMTYLYGGTLYSADNPKTMKDLTITDLGVCGKVKITDENTTIIGVTGNPERIKQRGDNIKMQMEITKSLFDKEKLQDRFAKMTGGIAVIYVGGRSEVEVKEKRDRVDDAVAATLAAMDEGIVPGGGLTAYRISCELDDDIEYPVLECEKSNFRKFREHYFGLDALDVEVEKLSGLDMGKSIVYGAMCDPALYIFKNAGLAFENYRKHINFDDKTSGFNVLTAKPCDMIKEGIIDPAKVTRVALQNACAVSKMILTTDTVIVNAELVDMQN